MFYKLNSIYDRLRRFISPDDWMVKLLKLSVTKEESTKPGAVIIQVDGLSHADFERAIHKYEMPNLSRLLKKEGYTRRPHYCGLPSSTPSVQGNLFYGVKSCVPAFTFKDKKTGRLFNMFSPENAAEIENRMKKSGEPLLKGGSAYGNIYTGGAKEAHFCVSAIGWGTLLKAANPLAIIVFSMMHIHTILRAVVLTVMEFVLAIYDALRGFIEGKDFLNELRYIPFRVIGCVIAREVTGTGAKIDITRGMPVIHLNLAGYDEQAHHRGPRSKFAHWSLGAIDSVIWSVWKRAKKSRRRDYEVFIYSDHGQEDTVPYRELYGRNIQEAVNEVFREELFHGGMHVENRSNGHHWRAELLRNRPAAGKKSEDDINRNGGEPFAVITALGPLGHIYSPEKLTMRQKEKTALSLVRKAGIPIVITADGKGKAIAWTHAGKFRLPRDGAKVLGKNHPFLKEAARDLAGLTGHKDAGDIIISGLRLNAKPITFYNEHGSHAGPGPHETSGFAMLPPDTRAAEKKTITTAELRESIFKVLNRKEFGSMEQYGLKTTEGRGVKLKIMSYNIHACKGRDRLVRPERIARVIALHNPDIIALQEADTHGSMHQTKIIAELLRINYHYHSSVLLKTGEHGNAILSRFNMKLVKRGSLPSLMNTPFLEKRGAVWVEADVYGRKVQVITTHLSLFPLEGMLQIKALLGKDWLGHPDCKGPVIFCGDFNSLMNSRICKAVGKQYHSIHFHAPGYRHLKTFPSYFPLGLVDHIFLGGGVKALRIETPRTHLEKTASDHLPLIAEVRVE